MKNILFFSLLIALSACVFFGCGKTDPVVTEPSVTEPLVTNTPAVTDPPATTAPTVTEAVKAVEEYPDYEGKIELIGESDKDALSYKLGDDITFRFTLKYNTSTTVACREFRYTVQIDGAESYSGKASGSTGKFEITVPGDKVTEPGATTVRVTAVAQKGAILSTCMAGAIVNMEEITAMTSMPDDFEEFWKENLSNLITVDPTSTKAASGKHESNYFHYYKMDKEYMEKSINCSGMVSYLGSYDFYEVFLAAPGEMPAVFYISIPKNLKNDSYPILMRLNHYGARNALIDKNETMITVSVGPCGIPGVYYDDKTNTYTKASYEGLSSFMDLSGDYDNPESAFATYMLMRNVQVLRFLSNPEYTKGTPFEAVTALYDGKVNFYGGSLGGFQSISTATLLNFISDLGEDVGAPAKIEVIAPSMSDITTRAGKTKRLSQSPLFSAPYPNLLYFDTSHFVAFLEAEHLIISGGFADTNCPPSGMAILYNVAKCKVSLDMTQNRGHSGENPKTIIKYTRSK